jgi:hypothetical protein
LGLPGIRAAFGGMNLVVETCRSRPEASRGWRAQTAGVLVLSVRPKAAQAGLGWRCRKRCPAGRASVGGAPWM